MEKPECPRPRIGVDLGGRRIIKKLLNDDGSIGARLRVPTPRDDYAGTLNAIAGVVTRLEAEAGVEASVGLGTPGAISPATGRIKNANSVWLNGQPLAEDLEHLLGRRLRFANDADCFALSEATDGAARSADGTVFGVILGTGVGGGIVVHGRLVQGPNAIAGEWGHNPLPWAQDAERPGPACYCGRSGCVETFLSGPALAREYEQATGEPARTDEVVLRATQGDPAAEATLSAYEERLARALASAINILDPAAIVLGGGLSNIDRLYARVPELWGPYVFSDRVDTRLLAPVHGDSSGVRGAARLWDA
jgi:predicted NBD/HSP70 family sugar kinase